MLNIHSIKTKDKHGITFCGIRSSINFDFYKFRYNLFTFNHFSIFYNSLVIEFSISTVFVPKLSIVEFIVVSLAYKMNETLALLYISLIKIFWSKRLVAEPFGTPIDIGLNLKTVSPICTNCFRLHR